MTSQDAMEKAMHAGLKVRAGVTPKDNPSRNVDPAEFSGVFHDLCDQFPEEDWHEARIGDWILAVDETLAAAEWCEVDLSNLLEWNILMGLLRAFPEPFLDPKTKQIAAGILGREELKSDSLEFWTLIRDVEIPC